MAGVPHSLVRELRRVADLAELDDATLLELVGASFTLAWSAGSRIFDADAPGEALYVILTGRVRISVPGGGQEAVGGAGQAAAGGQADPGAGRGDAAGGERAAGRGEEARDGREVAVLGPGDYFGEHSLLLHTGDAERAEAVEDTELMVVPRAALQRVLETNPDLADRFRDTLEDRLGSADA